MSATPQLTLSPRSRAGKRTALVVDDDASMRFVFSRSLERLGWAVEVAEDGIDVPELVSARHFDLVVLDLYMPGMNGFEVLRQLRRRFDRGVFAEPTERVKVIVASGESHPASIANAMTAGADEYLVKPVDIDLFDATIAKLFPPAARARS